MAHQRKRYIYNLIKKAKAYSPLIGLIGHRQVGKTTALEALCDAYTTLDIKDELILSEENPAGFLKKHCRSLQGIDECQLSPALFPALKEQVRKHKQPGQYLLSGSVRFTSRSAIRESLTGRIVNFELLPFSVSEIAHRELPNTLEKVMSHTHLNSVSQSLESLYKLNPSLGKEYKYYFNHGGLPGICFIQDSRIREQRILEQFRTILDRDIRLIYPTSIPFSQLFDFLGYIARTQGQNFSYADAQKEIGISPITQKKIINSFESVFLLRRLPIEGDYKGFCIYLEDQAESKMLIGNKLSSKSEYEQLVYRNLRTQLYYTIGVPFREFIYKTRGGVHIPYCIERNGFTLGIIPIDGDKPTLSEQAQAGSFLKFYQNSRVLFISESKKLEPIDNRSLLAPVYLFI